MHSFELTGETKVNFQGVTVHRIRATRDIPRAGVKRGDEGGWVESVELTNGDARLSGDAWVSGTAQVYGNARVYGNAWVYGNAQVSGDARLSGDAWVSGNAQVSGDARVEHPWHLLVIGPIGSEGVTATMARTKNVKHILKVGCWDGTLGTLMAEVKRRRAYWHSDEATQELWVAQYRALKALGRVTVKRWE